MVWSWLRRLFEAAEEPSVVPAVTGEPPADMIEDMRDYARREIGGGYSDREGAIQFVIDMFADQQPAEVLRPVAMRLVDEALAEHAMDATSWPETTDYDRLDAAFASLERDGIVARQNFSCCGTCGAAEIWDEIDATDARGGSARGYAFFHVQDTENAVDGSGLYLNYGACAEGEPAALAIAHDIVAHLAKAGLQTNWDGTYQRRIGVPLDWKRRRAR